MLDDNKIAELKAQHGDIYSITKAGTEIVYRACSAEELDRFLSLAETDKPQACVQLVTACILSPSLAEFEALRARKPGILFGENGLVTEIQIACGMSEAATSKKL